jgi:hypothetical protein
MRRLLVIGSLLAALVVAGCGNDTKTVTTTNAQGKRVTQTVPDIKFAKTKFLLHSGLAFGAFHRYILKPYRAGSFRKGAPGRTKALAKAGAAGLFAVHELKVARKDALADDHLRPLANRLDSAVSRIGGLSSLLKGGSLNPGQLLGAAGALTALGRQSAGAGATIKDRTAPSLGG